MSFTVNKKNVLITGGCGFIGSHIVDWVVQNGAEKIVVIDDLSAGTDTRYLKNYIKEGTVEFFKKDIRNTLPDASEYKDIDIIFHFAAQPSVPISVKKPFMDFEINVSASMKILEAMRYNSIPYIVFAASGGTMYGERNEVMSEDSALRPISNYGAAKAAFEMYLSSYSHLYEIGSISLRFGNIFGPRSTHGVMYDFYMKLKKNSSELEILGNGKQLKSYLYITDLINALDLVVKKIQKGSFNPYNISTERLVSVKEIADMVVNAMGLKNVEYKYTGGERGWPGDVRKISLDTRKIRSLGWKPKVSIEDGVKKYVEFLEAMNDSI